MNEEIVWEDKRDGRAVENHSLYLKLPLWGLCLLKRFSDGGYSESLLHICSYYPSAHINGVQSKNNMKAVVCRINWATAAFYVTKHTG